MKSVDEMTDEELTALAEQDVQRLIDWHCAEQGVPLLPPAPPTDPGIRSFPKDVTHYSVEGIMLLDMQEAVALRNFLAGLQSRRSLKHVGGGYSWKDPQYDVPYEGEPSISPIAVFSYEGAAAQKIEDASKEAKKSAFETAKLKWEEGNRKRDEIAEPIRNAIERAWQRKRRREELKREYDRYVVLSNGDEQVAKRFLQRAHWDARDVLPDLYPPQWNDEPAPVLPAPEELNF